MSNQRFSQTLAVLSLLIAISWGLLLLTSAGTAAAETSQGKRNLVRTPAPEKETNNEAESHTAAVPKAQAMFDDQLRPGQTAENIGLAYSIELTRGGAAYIVDSRFPFRSGDRIRFHIKSDIDGYLYISLASQNGDSQTLFPKAADPDNKIVKGADVLVPRHGDLRFDETPGKEALTLILSPQKLTQDFRKGERRVTVNPKTGAFSIPKDFAIDIAPSKVNGETTAADFRKTTKPSLTVVSTDVQKPLVIDLFLKHDPAHPDREDDASVSASNAADNKTSSDTASNESGGGGDNTVSRASQDRVGTGTKLDAVTGRSQSAVNGMIADKWAVVVGISKFEMPGLNLRFPEKDAHDMANFLIQKGHFAPDHVKLLIDSQATKQEILDKVANHWLPANAKPDDLIFIYMATHGAADELDPSKKNYILAHDSNPFHLGTTGIELNDLAKNVINKLPSNRVVVVLDTCYAGAIMPGSKSLFELSSFTLDELLQGTGQLVIGAASTQQCAHDSLRYKNGIFTKQLIDGLSLYPKLEDAFRYAKTHVEEEAICDFGKPQTPIIRDGSWKGIDLRLTLPPMKPRTPVE